MIVAKQVADLLSGSRMAIAFALGWAGFALGPGGLRTAAALLLLSWPAGEGQASGLAVGRFAKHGASYYSGECVGIVKQPECCARLASGRSDNHDVRPPS